MLERHQNNTPAATGRPPVVLGFRQIARILSLRHGVWISPASVRRSCRSAERRLGWNLAGWEQRVPGRGRRPREHE